MSTVRRSRFAASPRSRRLADRHDRRLARRAAALTDPEAIQRHRLMCGLFLLVALWLVFAPAKAATLAAGGSHTCAIGPGGTVYCWGSDSSGQLGNGATTGNSASPGLVVDGAGAALTGVTALATGNVHTCALRAGEVWCWGGERVWATG